MGTSSGIEIERRWLLKSLPAEIDIVSGGYRESVIKQSYISTNPVIRLRSHDDSTFVLCVKTKGTGVGLGKPENESELSREEFDNLFKFVKKQPIQKTRYYIPLNHSLIAELDIFSEPSNLIIVEVEFQSEKEAESFIPPPWFGEEEITKNKNYANSFIYKFMPDLVKK